MLMILHEFLDKFLDDINLKLRSYLSVALSAERINIWQQRATGESAKHLIIFGAQEVGNLIGGRQDRQTAAAP